MPGGLELVRDGAVFQVILDRPQRLNALDGALRLGIAETMHVASSDDSVGAIVITGRGDRAFCAGQDLNESAELGAEAGPAWMETWKRFFAGISGCTKPIVAAVNGTAAGAGLQLMLMADVRLAVPGARLLMAEVNVGLPAIAGSCLLDIHLGQSRMRDLVLSGDAFTAEQAKSWGLVQEICPREALSTRAREMATVLAGKPPLAMKLTVGFLRNRLRERLAEAERAAAAYQSEAIASGQPQRAMQQFLAAKAAAAQSDEEKSETGRV